MCIKNSRGEPARNRHGASDAYRDDDLGVLVPELGRFANVQERLAMLVAPLAQGDIPAHDLGCHIPVVHDVALGPFESPSAGAIIDLCTRQMSSHTEEHMVSTLANFDLDVITMMTHH